MKTINIKGKEYVTVNERLTFFRTNEAYAGWSLETQIIDLTDNRVVMKAVIKNSEGRVMSTGIAYEKEDDKNSFVNKTSFIENCETSAWGRALANLGIGIEANVASADEVANAIMKQNEDEFGQNHQVKSDAKKSYKSFLQALDLMHEASTRENFDEFKKAARDEAKEKQWSQYEVMTFKKKLDEKEEEIFG